MNTPLDQALAPYDYAFPRKLIATAPAHPRDSARLMIYDRRNGSVTLDTFHNLTKYLPPRSVLVLNRTKVIPARIALRKENGTVCGALFLATTKESDGTDGVRMLIKGKMKDREILHWTEKDKFMVLRREGKEVILRPSFDVALLFHLLETYGQTPLPLYIKHSPLTEEQRRTEYQTVFAQQDGSIAAPTAGLHFTPELLQRIADDGHTIAHVTLHVNQGTFAPLTDEHLRTKTLHAEHYEIEPDVLRIIEEAKQSNQPIIAVGTTVVRTLESYARTGLPRGETTLFLQPGDNLRIVNHLITNFHVPRSSLLMLVATLTGRDELMKLYRRAIDERFRLFSFGDGMLIV